MHTIKRFIFKGPITKEITCGVAWMDSAVNHILVNVDEKSVDPLEMVAPIVNTCYCAAINSFLEV